MPRKTLSSMHDARDVEDKRLLEAGDHKLLLAGYFHAVRELCFLRLRDLEAADEAAQIVFLRLFRELKRGKTYTVPFRVVVWKVVEWTVLEAPQRSQGWAARPHSLGRWYEREPTPMYQFCDVPHHALVRLAFRSRR